MYRKFFILSLLIASLIVSVAEAKAKPENELKGSYPQNNPWDPRYAPDQNQQEVTNEQHGEGSEEPEPEAE